jgi:hypothetical protein
MVILVDFTDFLVQISMDLVQVERCAYKLNPLI